MASRDIWGLQEVSNGGTRVQDPWDLQVQGKPQQTRQKDSWGQRQTPDLPVRSWPVSASLRHRCLGWATVFRLICIFRPMPGTEAPEEITAAPEMYRPITPRNSRENSEHLGGQGDLSHCIEGETEARQCSGTYLKVPSSWKTQRNSGLVSLCLTLYSELGKAAMPPWDVPGA